MYLRTFGKFELEGSDLNGVKPLLLLAHLAILEKPKSKTELAGLFWINNQSAKSNRDLRLDSLRKVSKKLEDYGLTVHDDMYSTNLQCDVLEFQACIKHSLVDKALDLYRGSFLEGVKLENLKLTEDAIEWVEITRASCAHQFRRLLVREAQGQLVEDKHGKAEPYAVKAWDLIKAYGFDVTESNEDLETITKIFTALNHDLRFEVEEERSMYSDDALLIDPMQAKDSLKANTVKVEKKTNLFAPTFRFVGRSKDCVLINNLLLDGNHRLITLHGYGGVGKSRLAQEIGFQQLKTQNFIDGIFSISLQDVEDKDEIVVRIARVFDETLEQGSIENLVGKIKGKNSLLILDNYDHLVDKAYDIPATLLKHCSEISIMTTSREPLKIEEETIYPLGGMEIPEEVPDVSEVGEHDYLKLFEARAQKSNPLFAITKDNVDIVHKISLIIDGNALGIILAASLIDRYTLWELELKMHKGIQALGSPYKNTDARHFNLNTVFQLSFNQLDPNLQTVLCKLSLFLNSFSLEAACEIGQIERESIELLISKSLIQDFSKLRFCLHPIISEFTKELLRDNDRELALQKFMQYFYFRGVSWWDRYTQNQLLSLDEAEADFENYCFAVINFSQNRKINYLGDLSLFIARFSSIRGSLHVSYQLIIKIYGLLKNELNASYYEAQILLALSILSSNLYMKQALEYAERAYEILMDSEAKKDLLATMVGDLVAINYGNGYMNKAYILAKSRLSLYSKDEKTLSFGSSCHQLSYLAMVLGNYEEAQDFLDKGLLLDKKYGNHHGLALGYTNLGILKYLKKSYSEANKEFRHSLILAKEFKINFLFSVNSVWMAQSYLDNNQIREARKSLRKVRSMLDDLKEDGVLAYATLIETGVLTKEERFDEAIEKCRIAIELAKAVNYSYCFQEAIILYARLYVKKGKYNVAKEIIMPVKGTEMWYSTTIKLRELELMLS